MWFGSLGRLCRYCGGDAVEGVGIYAVIGPFAALVAADEAAVDEQLHMVRDGGLAQSQWFGQVADTGFSTVRCSDEGYQLYPCRIGERFEHRREAFGGRVVQHAASQR